MSGKDEQEIYAHNTGAKTTVHLLNRCLERNKQLETDLAQARHVVQANTEFMARISHEIRTPLNGVVGLTELLLETKITRHQREMLEVLARSGEGLIRLANNFLEFSTPSAHDPDLLPDEFDLKKLIEDVLLIVQVNNPDKSLQFRQNYPKSLPRVYFADEHAVRQILLNVIGNAEKFTLRGEVSLRVRKWNENGQVGFVVKVQDTGIGIAKSQLGTIFNAYKRIEGTANRGIAGTGLGLAIAAQLTRKMGGRIEVASRVGEGSCFSIYLPLPVVQNVKKTRPLFARTNPKATDELQNLSPAFPK